MLNLPNRFSNALKAGRSAIKDSPATMPLQRYVLALVFDLALEEAQNIANTVQKGLDSGMILVLVTDQTDISIFQHQGCITEYLPATPMLAKRFPQKATSAYLETRLSILLHKWNPVQTIAFGDNASKLLSKIESTQGKMLI